jgi:hypothetical protein
MKVQSAHVAKLLTDAFSAFSIKAMDFPRDVLLNVLTPGHSVEVFVIKRFCCCSESFNYCSAVFI